MRYNLYVKYFGEELRASSDSIQEVMEKLVDESHKEHFLSGSISTNGYELFYYERKEN